MTRFLLALLLCSALLAFTHHREGPWPFLTHRATSTCTITAVHEVETIPHIVILKPQVDMDRQMTITVDNEMDRQMVIRPQPSFRVQCENP